MVRHATPLLRLETAERQHDECWMPCTRVASSIQHLGLETSRAQVVDKRYLRQRASNSAEPVVERAALRPGYLAAENDLRRHQSPAWLEDAEGIGHGPRLLRDVVEDPIGGDDIGHLVGHRQGLH